MPTRRRTPTTKLQAALAGREVTLLDLVDSLIDKGALLNADLTLGLANVDLVYVRLSSLIAAADRILSESGPRLESRETQTMAIPSRAAKRKARRRR
ncbi:MAG: gas vesicle protein [Acidobacteria bacterium]|nr:gas vesicle protein [Acidobacteriota bacterium]